MLIKTKGVVLRQRKIGEQDLILTLCTADLGQIEATARGVKSVKSKLSAAIHVTCYSEFVLYRGNGDRYYINSAEALSPFFGLREDVEALSLASYFCELFYLVAPSKEEAGEGIRLLLNTLAFLEKKKFSQNFLKAVYELRILSISGFMPDLVGCSSCGAFQKENMHFLPTSGQLICADCCDELPCEAIPLTDSVLSAMRHIVYSDLDKLYAFRVSKKSEQSLAYVTESFVLPQIDRPCQTLSFYHSIRITEQGESL